MVVETLFFVVSCLVIVVSAVKMRSAAMEGREKLRRPMNSLILVDQGGPFDWKIVDIGSPMDVALGGSYKKNEDAPHQVSQFRSKPVKQYRDLDFMRKDS